MNSGLPCSQIRLAILFDATTFGWCGTCYDIMNGLVKTDHIGPNSRKGRHLCCEHHMSICGGVLEVCGYGGYPKEKKKESPSTQSWLPIQTTTWHSIHFFMTFKEIIAIEVIHYLLKSLLCGKPHVLWKRKVREVAWTKFTSSTHQFSNKPEFDITVFFLHF